MKRNKRLDLDAISWSDIERCRRMGLIPAQMSWRTVGESQRDIADLIAALRERDATIARVVDVAMMSVEEIAQPFIAEALEKARETFGCEPEAIGPEVRQAIIDAHIAQVALYAGPVLDALSAALYPKEKP